MGDEIRAAGCVVVRGPVDDLQVLLIHRPEYDDWSHPKGKCDDGEKFRAAARRETHEETGLKVKLGPRLSTVRYPDAQGRPKKVKYWIARPKGNGKLRRKPDDEVDQVVWVSPRRARRQLTQHSDRALLAEALEVLQCSL